MAAAQPVVSTNFFGFGGKVCVGVSNSPRETQRLVAGRPRAGAMKPVQVLEMIARMITS